MNLKLESRGNEVTRLQENLNCLGYRLKVTGFFCPDTRAAVLQFQHSLGLATTGVAGDKLAESAESLARPYRLVSPAPAGVNGVGIWSKYSDRQLPSVRVIVVSRDLGRYLIRCLDSLKASFAQTSSVADIHVLDAGSQDNTHAVACGCLPADHVHRRPYEDLAISKNEVLAKITGPDFPVIAVISAADTVTLDYASTLLSTLILSGKLAAFGSVRVDGSLHTASREDQVNASVPFSSLMFHESLLANGPLWPEDLPLSHDRAAQLSWFKSGIMAEPTATVVADIQFNPHTDIKWPAARNKIVEIDQTDMPLVSCLMVTGKCPARLALARIAVDCFLKQTWSCKELVIVNHGPDRLDVDDSRVTEISVKKGPGVALGDLRNMSIKAAHGDWCACWDDDDWHHPKRLEHQMRYAEKDTLVTYLWQIRLNLLAKSAFYDKMDGGQHMSVLFNRLSGKRYPSIESGEDTVLINSFDKVHVIDNSVLNPKADPLQYVRTFHGNNVCSEKHIMEGSDQHNLDRRGELKLTEYHQDRIAAIIKLYEASGYFELIKSKAKRK